MENNLIVLAFDEEPINLEDAYKIDTKAEGFLENVLAWQEQGVVDIEDAVVVLCGISGDLKVKQTKSLAGKYSLRGSGIGLLAGILLGGPIGGAIVGAGIGAISGKMKDIGIDDKFIKEVSQGLAPNTSALFLLGKALDPDKLMEELKPFKALVAISSLDEEREKAFRKALEREE